MRSSLVWSNLLLFRLAVPSLALLAGCATRPGSTSQDMAPPPPALSPCSPAIPKGATPSTMGDDTPAAACTEATSAIQHAKADELSVEGYEALGPAVQFTLATATAFPHGVDFQIPADLAKGPDGATSARIVILAKRGSAPSVVIPGLNVVYDAGYQSLHFHAQALATFQAAIPKAAGGKKTRHYTFRAIGGVSMGGIGSSINFWTATDRYDALGVMGADPGPDLTYSAGLLHDWFFSGFCTAADEAAGRGKIGEVNPDGTAKCPSPRKPMLDQNERPMDFEHLPYQAGEGVGLTSNRKFWLRGFRDISRAFGNAAYSPSAKTPEGTYLPPGVPGSILTRPNDDVCAHPVVLKSFYDWQYNPDGKFPVITFCDGGDLPGHNGVFDPTQPQTVPAQILLAVDVNGNGKRDAGEPVLLQGSEHLYDFGTDGIPDEKEPGYDAASNPDPNHDDYHWFWNPTGTENNWRYDAGEKYDDFGVDGIKGKGCDIAKGAGCYDYGEGNGKFDYTQNAENWYAHDPHRLIEALSDDALDRLDVYYDAGIRDFLDDAVSTNSLIGVLQARAQHVRVWDGFPLLAGYAPSLEDHYNADKVDFALHGRHVYVRYGDPDLSDDVVMQTGDGRHVGTVVQAVHRAQTMIYALGKTWPGLDTDTNVSSGMALSGQKFTAANGRVTPYAVVTPPGYDDPGREKERYPVLYLMHGLGMDPDGLVMIGTIAGSMMVNDKVPAARRLPKMIVVIADGKCRPGGDVQDGPLPPDGDLCEEGTYYSDHLSGGYLGQTELKELEALIESKYRTMAPADLEVQY